MTKVRLLLASAMCATIAAVAAAPAAADPTGEQLTFTCGGVPVTLTLLPTGGGKVAFTASTSVGIAVGDSASGSLTPGFEQNAVQTTQCSIEFDGELLTVTAFFTPPST